MALATLPLRGLARAVLAWFLLAPLLLAGAAAADAPAPGARWYEILRAGQKIGWAKVAWSASTWGERVTVHDRTEIVTRTARDMAGHIDVFEVRTRIDLERDADGTLWSQRIEVQEPGRTTVETLAWTGSAYVHSAEVDGHELVTTVALEAPVMTDAEAFLSERARAGTLVKGEKLVLRELDVQGKRARSSEVEVLGPEEVEGEDGPVPTVKIAIRQPETRSESWMWLDAEGAFVQTLSDTGMAQRRAPEARARTLTGRPPSFSITGPSRPKVERVMSADRLWVEIALEDDPARKLPDFPASPWGVIGAPRRDPERGWVLAAELRRHDDPEASASLPIDPAAFAQDLAPTPLMPCKHADLVARARDIIGPGKDAREAAGRLARWVYEELDKQSLEVAQGSALQILEQRRGDCSEHALLFVALCRAAGIPARRCSGWVNIGPMWGSHAWAEIWVGRWIAADPTTGEVGPAARYLFFGYSDDADSFPGVVSARVEGRISVRCTKIEEDGVQLALDPDDDDHVLSGETPARWFLHPASGIELRDLPEGWTAKAQDGVVLVRGPGLQAAIEASADQGQVLDTTAGAARMFAGRPAVSFGNPPTHSLMLQSRRRLLQIQVRSKDERAIEVFERCFAPTLAAVVTAPGAETAADDGTPLHGAWEIDRAGTLERQGRRVLAGLPAPARERLAPRLVALVDRLELDLTLEADGRYRMHFLRALRSGEVRSEEVAGDWRVSAGRLDLGLLPSAGGQPEGLGTLADDGRLHFDHGDWNMVLRRAGR